MGEPREEQQPQRIKKAKNFYLQNAGAKYSRFRGGAIGVPRQVLADHSFPQGDGIFLVII